MTHRIYTARTPVEVHQHCNRQRYLEYHHPNGTAVAGLQPARTPLPLAVGSCVHSGLEVLLREGQALYDILGRVPELPELAKIEDAAVAVALADFRQYTQPGAGIELDAQEQAQLAAVSHPDYVKQLAASLGGSPEDLGLDTLMQRAQAAVGEFDRYLVAEQSALVEAMVRAYTRRRLRPLLEQFEVLEVEREGQWQIAEWQPSGECSYSQLSTPCTLCGSIAGRGVHTFLMDGKTQCHNTAHDVVGRPIQSYDYELWFMSRPDALLRERVSNQLYILSFKTTGAWDIRKERDAQHDMQGLSEGVEVERRLAEWWQQVHAPGSFKDALGFNIPTNMYQFLKSCAAPPRILAIRYEYLLKGERWKDKDLTARLGVEVRSQRSPLIRQYVATSTPKRGGSEYNVGDVCWSWDFIKETGEAGSLAWQNWHSQPVWEAMSVKEWIDRLDDAQEALSGYDSTVGMEPRALGWKSAAQRLGYTPRHPLDTVFVPPIVIYRNDDELRDWVEQVASQEKRVAEGAAAVNAAQDEGERRHLLNVHFPQTRRACSYPSECVFVKLCWSGGEDIRRAPVASSVYRAREANHPIEGERHNGK